LRNTASAVAGLSGTVCGLYAATEGAAKPPEQVVFDLADRFVGAMKDKGGITEPQRYGNTYTLAHDPLVWREAGDHFLAEAGVQVLFHTTVIDVLTEGRAGRPARKYEVRNKRQRHKERAVACTKRRQSYWREQRQAR
jgi:hypothetical protein